MDFLGACEKLSTKLKTFPTPLENQQRLLQLIAINYKFRSTGTSSMRMAAKKLDFLNKTGKVFGLKGENGWRIENKFWRFLTLNLQPISIQVSICSEGKKFKSRLRSRVERYAKVFKVHLFYDKTMWVGKKQIGSAKWTERLFCWQLKNYFKKFFCVFLFHSGNGMTSRNENSLCSSQVIQVHFKS